MANVEQQVKPSSTVYIDVKKAEASFSDEEKKVLGLLKRYRAAANYLSASQLYLQDNFLVKEPLKPEHIKDRLLGHWGTCPGINLVYAHCNHLIKKHNQDMVFVLGPGHGAPAVLSNLYLAEDLKVYYPDYDLSMKGLSRLLKDFSWPGGWPSHVNPMYPGSIHEGGELGYSLSVSYGAVMNHPDLIVTCLVGDGEAETGPLATSWHSHKWIDPKSSGAVIPILHLNGYKISSCTIFGSMSDHDLECLFQGYGYQVRIVHDIEHIDVEMAAAMEWAYQEIKTIQNAARVENKPIFRPRWPMIVLQTPKGWTGVKEFDGKKIEGSYRAHQIPLKEAKKNSKELAALEQWLTSYNTSDLFEADGSVKKDVLSILPPEHLRMGRSKYANPEFKALALPELLQYAVNIDTSKRGSVMESPTGLMGKFLADVWKNNSNRFKIFSPDELESNKLDWIFNMTKRNYQWERPEFAAKDGGVVEVLSEHNCQGWLQGYTMTGRFGIFPSYEAFLGIITTMLVQYIKFIDVASTLKWRQKYPAMTYVETSTLWRQEHNGFSHQQPGFLNSLLSMKSQYIRIYLPPDANTLVCTINHCLKGKHYCNLIVSSKLPQPVWLTMQEAIDHCRVGCGIWKWASTDEGLNPDVVLVGCGNEITTEVIAAAMLLREHVPLMRVRVVNVTDLMVFDSQRSHPRYLTDAAFDALFTKDKPVIFNFHGYPSCIKQLLHGRPKTERFDIHGYLEEGTTTTPFSMLTCNKVSRYDICISALEKVMVNNPIIALDATMKIAHFQHKLRLHKEYAMTYGKDPADLEQTVIDAASLKKVYDDRKCQWQCVNAGTPPHTPLSE